MNVIDRRGKVIFFWGKAMEGKGLFIFFKRFLIFCSCLFGLGIIVRRFAYICGIKKKVKLNARVISIGNITLGGTGKTPLVEYIARRAKKINRKAVILSRGYGGGDEAGLLLKKLNDVSVLTGKNRAEFGKEAVDRLGAELILLDDGFQHWPLERDMDIVAIDSTSPLWEDRLFPAGTLRERVSNLKRAHAFVLTRVNTSESDLSKWYNFLSTINQHAPIFLARHAPREFVNRQGKIFSLSFIRDKDIIVFSGIARPQAFEETINGLCGKLIHSIRYPDHYRYNYDDLSKIEKKSAGASCIITTEKDLVRIKDSSLDERLLALVVELEFLKDGDKFENKIFYG